MKSLLMGAALAVSLASAAWGEVWTVEPGVGVGPVKLSQGMLDPTRILTPDKKSQGTLAGNQGIYLTYKEKIETECQGNRITMIVVKTGGFTSRAGSVIEVQGPGGIKLGSSGPQAQSAFGAGAITHNLPTAKGDPVKMYYAWPYKGVGVITEGGKVIQFEVFPRK